LWFIVVIGYGYISGTFVVSVYGAILFAMSATVFAIGQEKWNYFGGMLLLGIAWNFSFSAGTVMLTESYLPHEATDVQAVNDFILFTIAGMPVTNYLHERIFCLMIVYCYIKVLALWFPGSYIPTSAGPY
jgi:hypothetical protein